jgi:signal transduction histidine kinase
MNRGVQAARVMPENGTLSSVKQVFQNLRDKGDKLTSTYLTIVLISAGVFLVGFMTTSIFARTVAVQNKTNYEEELTQQAQTVRLQVAERVYGYNQLLYAAAAQFSAKPDMTKEDWQRFYTTMQVEKLHPAVVGLTYGEKVATADIPTFEASMQEAGREGFAVHPNVPGDDHIIVKYVEPASKVRTETLGYDMDSEAARRDAMAAALHDGEAHMTRPIRLLQDAPDAQTTGSVIYLPVYRGVTTPDTEEGRKASLTGFVAVGFHVGDIMARIVGNTPRLNDNVNVSLVSISSGTGQTMYSARYSQAQARNLTTVTRDISVYGQTWRISIAGQDQLINQFYGPLGLFFLGAGASMLIALIVYFALMNRLVRVQQVYEEDVENTKSELLALASHQLRTPATGVKQYLGILRDGIMGQLTPAQQDMVEKAYETNERQLHVINDLLYVSKVEAGQLMIDPVITDVRKIAQDVINNLKSKAEEKDITIAFTAKKPVVITADDRYVGMIIENLISNAIKYSYPSSTVRVNLTLASGTMTLKVSDKGVGIKPEDIERAFNKFNRIENPLSRQEGGSGLGLFLANQLAKGHGGTIEVEPNGGKGTTFVLTLPSVAMIDHDIVNLAEQHKRGRRVTG